LFESWGGEGGGTGWNNECWVDAFNGGSLGVVSILALGLETTHKHCNPKKDSGKVLREMEDDGRIIHKSKI